jgi:hypothetical protein
MLQTFKWITVPGTGSAIIRGTQNWYRYRYPPRYRKTIKCIPASIVEKPEPMEHWSRNILLEPAPGGECYIKFTKCHRQQNVQKYKGTDQFRCLRPSAVVTVMLAETCSARIRVVRQNFEPEIFIIYNTGNFFNL